MVGIVYRSIVFEGDRTLLFLQMGITIKVLLLAFAATFIVSQLNTSPFSLPQLPPTPHPIPLTLVPRLLAQSYSAKQISLSNTKLYGSWSSPIPPFVFFSGLSGYAQQYFIYNDTLTTGDPPHLSTIPHVNTIAVVLFDPEYVDKKVAIMYFPVNGTYDPESGCWKGTTNDGRLYLYQNMRSARVEQGVNIEYVVNQTLMNIKSIKPNETTPNQTSSNQTSNKSSQSTPSNLSSNESSSPPPFSSPFTLTLTQHPPVIHGLTPWLLLIPCLILFLGMHFRQNIPPLKISFVTVLVSLNFILFVALLELYTGIENIGNKEGWLILTGMVTCMTAVRFTQGFEEAARRIVGFKGYLWFYTISFLYLWVMLTCYTEAWFQVLNSLILLPQIIHNAYRGIKPGFSSGYYLVILSNQLYVFYYRGIPHNLLRISPSFPVCACICLSMLLQLLILACQDKYGSRFFIPKCCIPNYYNYYIEVDLTDVNKSMTHPLMEDCPICLFPLSEEPGDAVDFEKGGVQNGVALSVQTKKKLMKTPCMHTFHVGCLENWMEHKFQCPIDRSKLPPLQ